MATEFKQIVRSDAYNTPKDGLYTAIMVEKLKEQRREKRPVSTTQCASTQAIIDRPQEKDEEWRNRPIPENWLAVKDADLTDLSPENLKKITGQREFTPGEIALIEDIRRKGRNTLGDSVSMGASSVTEINKERAIEAFRFTPPTPLTAEEKIRLVALTPITPPKVEPVKVEKKKQRFGWINRWVFGRIKDKDD